VAILVIVLLFVVNAVEVFWIVDVEVKDFKIVAQDETVVGAVLVVELVFNIVAIVVRVEVAVVE
jgi:hypothetical protein